MSQTAPPRQVSYVFAREKGMVCLPQREALTVAVREDARPVHLLEMRRLLGRVFEVEGYSRASYEQLLEEIFSRGPVDSSEVEAAMDSRRGLESLIDNLPESTDVLEGADDAPIISLINGILHDAVRRRASDIHIDPFEDRLSIRYRIDGDLSEVLAPPRQLSDAIASRIKVMSRLDIAERRLPQDGRISLSIGGRSIDVRVATLPTRFGERIVLRLLDTRNALLDLSDLGMDPDTFRRFADVLTHPNGVVLVTGPVGSGKTTTLYSALSRLNTGRGNIMTLEDPIEYGLPGISQTQMDHRVGLTFAATLRSILRQDPNIVMVGEIRDVETAEVAFEFASTGRLALSTLHTNSAAGAITRLRDMGVEPYLVASTLRAVLAQRLVRQLCDNCKHQREATEEEKRLLEQDPARAFMVHDAEGCLACGHTGYKGRIGIYELLVVDPDLRHLISAGAGEHDIDAAAFRRHDHLLDNGLRHIMTGATSPGEVISACRKEGRHADV
ncbi:MAG: Flp pilus assembly complex ATPase component TadA [Hyphomonas sp.]|nr:Flp pilus assembly complex ATPase component TadA [Hyphomonas sp.]